MEPIHVVFYDKKIQGLTNERFHENLKLENEAQDMRSILCYSYTQIL